MWWLRSWKHFRKWLLLCLSCQLLADLKHKIPTQYLNVRVNVKEPHLRCFCATIHIVIDAPTVKTEREWETLSLEENHLTKNSGSQMRWPLQHHNMLKVRHGWTSTPGQVWPVNSIVNRPNPGRRGCAPKATLASNATYSYGQYF